MTEPLLAAALAAAGAAWGAAADRIATRWPEHEAAAEGRAPGWRTAVTAVAGAVLLGALPGRFPEPLPAVVVGAYLAGLVLALATDLDQRIIPDRITLPAIPAAVALALAGVNPLVGPGSLPVAALVSVALPLLLLAASIPFGPGAFGLGDVKLLVSVGLLAGPLPFLLGVLYGTALAGVVVVALVAARRITLRDHVPFGPFLIAGGAWAILAAP